MQITRHERQAEKMNIEELRVDDLVPYEVASAVRAKRPGARMAIVNKNYIVSDDGRIFRLWKRSGKWKEQKARKHSNGYIRGTIDGKDVYVHRIVATLFCENPDGKTEINHKDGNKANNRAENLEWCTRSENNRHAFATGLRDYEDLKTMSRSKKAKDARKRRRKLTFEQAEEIRRTNESDRVIAALYGISRGQVWQIKHYKSYKEA